MTYLELINSVLVRLREPKANSGNYESDPFYLMIGACVNDAKDMVEDAWDWTALRGTQTSVCSVGESIMRMDDSANTHYRVKYVLDVATGNYIPQASPEYMLSVYANDVNSPVASGAPSYWAYTTDYWNALNDADVQNGDIRIQFDKPADVERTYQVVFVRHQDQLSLPDTRLRVPDLPVYTLAAALAARERGEIGGAPVNELFSTAKQHLSDAIAKDANKYPEEFTWYTPRHEYKGNWAN